MWKKICVLNNKYDNISEPMRMILFLYALLSVWGVGFLLDKFVFVSGADIFSYGFLFSTFVLCAAIVMRIIYFKTPKKYYLVSKTVQLSV